MGGTPIDYCYILLTIQNKTLKLVLPIKEAYFRDGSEVCKRKVNRRHINGKYQRRVKEVVGTATEYKNDGCQRL